MLTTLRYWRLNLALWLDDNGPALFILGALLLVLGVVQLGRALLPQRATVIVSATATPALQLLPTPQPAGDVLPRAVTAYAAPGGAILGAIEPGRPYAIVARAGSEWLQLNVQDSGLVWVRWADSGLVPAGELADLTPAPPQVVYVEVVRPQVVNLPAPLPPQPQPVEPASGAVAEVVYTVNSAPRAMDGDRRQAGPAQCSNDGRSCLGQKPKP